jgi:hypothetical protein
MQVVHLFVEYHDGIPLLRIVTGVCGTRDHIGRRMHAHLGHALFCVH